MTGFKHENFEEVFFFFEIGFFVVRAGTNFSRSNVSKEGKLIS